MFFFFFSSRRRHTRLTCDWSSDVCSSDLSRVVDCQAGRVPSHRAPGRARACLRRGWFPNWGRRLMLVNLVPEFLAILAAPDPTAAYHEYLDRHKPVLQSYWHNYVLDPTSPHAEQVIAATLRAERADLERLLEDVDVA